QLVEGIGRVQVGELVGILVDQRLLVAAQHDLRSRGGRVRRQRSSFGRVRHAFQSIVDMYTVKMSTDASYEALLSTLHRVDLLSRRGPDQQLNRHLGVGFRA